MPENDPLGLLKPVNNSVNDPLGLLKPVDQKEEPLAGVGTPMSAGQAYLTKVGVGEGADVNASPAQVLEADNGVVKQAGDAADSFIALKQKEIKDLEAKVEKIRYNDDGTVKTAEELISDPVALATSNEYHKKLKELETLENRKNFNDPNYIPLYSTKGLEKKAIPVEKMPEELTKFMSSDPAFQDREEFRGKKFEDLTADQQRVVEYEFKKNYVVKDDLEKYLKDNNLTTDKGADRYLKTTAQGFIDGAMTTFADSWAAIGEAGTYVPFDAINELVLKAQVGAITEKEYVAGIAKIQQDAEQSVLHGQNPAGMGINVGFAQNPLAAKKIEDQYQQIANQNFEKIKGFNLPFNEAVNSQTLPFESESSKEFRDASKNIKEWAQVFEKNPYFKSKYNDAVAFVPNVLAPGAGTLASLVATGLVAGPMATAATGSLQMAATGYEDALKSGGTPSSIISSYMINGGLGATDAIPVAEFFNDAKLFSRLIKNKKVAAGVSGGIIEAIQETGQNIGSNYTAKELYDKNRDVMQGVKDAAIAALLLGASTDMMLSKHNDENTSADERKQLAEAIKTNQQRIEEIKAAAQEHKEGFAINMETGEVIPKAEQDLRNEQGTDIQQQMDEDVLATEPVDDRVALSELEDGTEVEYQGLTGTLSKDKDGYHVTNDDGVKTLIEGGENPDLTLEHIGVKPLSTVTGAGVRTVTAPRQRNYDGVEYNGEKYFVSLDDPNNPDGVGDKVFKYNKDGSLTEVHYARGANKSKKLAIINSAIKNVGIPQRLDVKPSVEEKTILADKKEYEEKEAPKKVAGAEPREPKIIKHKFQFEGKEYTAEINDDTAEVQSVRNEKGRKVQKYNPDKQKNLEEAALNSFVSEPNIVQDSRTQTKTEHAGEGKVATVDTSNEEKGTGDVVEKNGNYSMDNGSYADVDKKGDEWHIEYIESKKQRKGDGTKIINKIVSDAKKQGVKKIGLQTGEGTAYGFAKKLGFKEVGENKDRNNISMELAVEQSLTKNTPTGIKEPIIEKTTPEKVLNPKETHNEKFNTDLKILKTTENKTVKSDKMYERINKAEELGTISESEADTQRQQVADVVLSDKKKKATDTLESEPDIVRALRNLKMKKGGNDAFSSIIPIDPNAVKGLINAGIDVAIRMIKAGLKIADALKQMVQFLVDKGMSSEIAQMISQRLKTELKNPANGVYRPKNIRELEYTLKEVFNLSKREAKAAAKVIDMMGDGYLMAEMVDSKEEFYDEYLPGIIKNEFTEGIDQKLIDGLNQLQSAVYYPGKKIIQALTDPNVTSPIHETAHAFFDDILKHIILGNDKAGEIYNSFLEEANSKSGRDFWSKHFKGDFDLYNYKFQQEFFARGFEQYLKDGVEKPGNLGQFFEMIKNFFNDIYNNIVEGSLDINLSDKAKKMYDKVLGLDSEELAPSTTFEEKNLKQFVEGVEKLHQEKIDRPDSTFGLNNKDWNALLKDIATELKGISNPSSTEINQAVDLATSKLTQSNAKEINAELKQILNDADLITRSSFKELRGRINDMLKGSRDEKVRMAEIRAELKTWIAQNRKAINSSGIKLSSAVINRVNNAKTLLNIHEAIDYLNELLIDADFKRQEQKRVKAISDLRWLLNPQRYVKKEHSILRGKKVDPETIDMIVKLDDRMRNNSRGQAMIDSEKLVDEILNGRLDSNNNRVPLSPDEVIENQEKLYELQFSGIEDADLAEVENLLIEAEQLIEHGRTAYDTKKAAEKLQDEADVKQVLEDVTNGKPSKKDPNSPEASGKKPGAVSEFLIHEFNDLTTALDNISPGSKEGSMASFLATRFGHAKDNAETKARVDLMDKTKEIHNKKRELFGAKGLEYKRMVSRNAKKKHDITFTDTAGEKRTVHLTMNQMAYDWGLAKNASSRSNIKFGGIEAGQEYFDALDAQVPQYMKDYVTWIMNDLLPGMHPYVNKVYRKLNGINLANVKNYLPQAVADSEIENDSSWNMYEVFGLAGASPSSIKSRVQHGKQLRHLDIDQAVAQYVLQSTKYANYAEIFRDMKKMFWNPKVATTIADYHGKAMLDLIRGYIDVIGNQKATSSAYKILDSVRKNVAFATLAAKIPLALYQIGNSLMYLTQLPLNAQHKYFTGGIKSVFDGDLRDNIVDMIKSDYFRQRFGYGASWEITEQLMMGKGKLGAGKFGLRQLFMIPTIGGDIAATIIGGYPVYKYHYDNAIKQGFSKEVAKATAIEQWKRATDATQQSSFLSRASLEEARGSELTKWFTMYMSQPRQINRLIWNSYKNMRQGRITPAKFAQVFIMSHVVMPMLIQFIANGLKWDWEDEGRAGVIGNLNSIFVLGQLIESASNMFVGNQVYDIQIPFVKWIEDVVTQIDKTADDYDKYGASPDVNYDSIILASHLAGIFLPVPAGQIQNVVRAERDDSQNKGMRYAGWSSRIETMGKNEEKAIEADRSDALKKKEEEFRKNRKRFDPRKWYWDEDTKDLRSVDDQEKNESWKQFSKIYTKKNNETPKKDDFYWDGDSWEKPKNNLSLHKWQTL